MGGTRSYTNEQIQFVLDAWIDGKKAPEIVQVYRQAFGDQRFGVSQVKYLKSAYGEDAEFGVPLVNRVMRPSSATDGATPSARTLAGASLSQRGYGRPPMRPVAPSAGPSQQLPASTQQQQPAGFLARLASEPAPLATMPGFDFGGGPSFSGGGGLVAPGPVAASGTTSAAAGMSTASCSGPRSVPFGATRPAHGPVAQRGGPGYDTTMAGHVSNMTGRSISGPGGAFWSGPGLGPLSLAQKKGATAPFGSTSGSIPDATIQLTTATTMTTPAPTGFSSSSAGLAGKTVEPPTPAWALQAGKAPAGGDQKAFLLPSALEAPQSTGGSSEDWVVLSPRAGPRGEEDMIGWRSTSHHGCPIEAKHRHDPDGGIHFGGMPDLHHAMAAHLCARLEGVSRLERYAHLAVKGARDDDDVQEEEGEEEQQQQQCGARSGVPEASTAPGSVAGKSTAMEQCEPED